ncbi:MAG TPA: class I SAM-dependent RNA methyltransferase [Candidatus Binatia bacterium]|nr:class I SAM-dependent RNA methyltransferase [Candidatus Binatia bacterium]
MALDLIATSTFGLEAVVMRELEALGYESSSPQTGRVEYSGDEHALVRSNLWLRSADRVLIRVGRAPAADFDTLFDFTLSLPWEDWIPPDAAFPVAGRSVRSRLSSVPAVQRTVKKAIVERLMRAHRRSHLPETGPVVAVEAALLKDVATLTIDSSGAGLHKRGYRDLTGTAPLRETLAAALVELSFWKRDRPLIDPFCGTGTIVIEAALQGRSIAPGLERTFAAEDWPAIDAGLWDEHRQAAQDTIGPALQERIVATDIDEDSLSMARRHAERAGVAEDIHFQRRAFQELSSQRRHGCVVTNPPYGVRIEDRRDVLALYESMPEVFARLPTWSFFVLTSWPDFEQVVGRRAERRRKLYNAQIECTYYQFHGPRP